MEDLLRVNDWTFHNSVPVISQSGINVQPGTSTELGVTTQVVETTDVARRRFTPEQRECYFEDEIRMVKGLKFC